MSTLDLPYIATIPYNVQADETLPDSVKLFFGQITGLSVKCGYIWATDQQLADMKGTPLPNIQRWLKLLETKGFIRRQTYNTHVKTEDGSWKWKKNRKIFIEDGFKSKQNPKTEEEVDKNQEDSELIKNDESIELIKNDESIELIKNDELIINPSDVNLKLQSDVASRVVVFPDSLDLLELDLSFKLKICNEYTKEQIDKAVERALKWKGRPTDAAGVMTALTRADSWQDYDTPEDIEFKNSNFMKTLAYYDGKKIAHNSIVVCKKHVEFTCGIKCVTFGIEDKEFIKKVSEHIEYLKTWEVNNMPKK